MKLRTGLLMLSGLLCGFLAAHLWRTHGRPAIVVTPTPVVAEQRVDDGTQVGAPESPHPSAPRDIPARPPPQAPAPEPPSSTTTQAALPPSPRDTRPPAGSNVVAAPGIDAPS